MTYIIDAEKVSGPLSTKHSRHDVWHMHPDPGLRHTYGNHGSYPRCDCTYVMFFIHCHYDRIMTDSSFCTKCGQRVSGDAIYCPSCGAPIEGRVDPRLGGMNAQEFMEKQIIDSKVSFNLVLLLIYGLPVAKTTLIH